MATKMDVDQGAVAQGNADMDVDEENAQVAKVFMDLMDKARDLETTSPDNAIQAYKDIVFNKQDLDDPTAKGRERAIYALADFLVTKKRAADIRNLSQDLRPLYTELPKAKAAKIERTLISVTGKIPDSQAIQIEMCLGCIEWCKGDKRTFLRQRVETRLAGLYLQQSRYTDALDLLAKLLTEVKKLDDKLLLVEIFLIGCRTHYAVKNIPKSKADLTAAKTNANAIHCPPLLQAEIDIWSGVIGMREKDYRTAYSYFYESFEAYNAGDKEEDARKAMKYMMLAKIMIGRPQETNAIISSKHGLKYTGKSIDAMSAVAGAHEKRDLKIFEAVIEKYKAELREDPIVDQNLTDLNETLLEQNVLRILEPFSSVEVDHVAELIDLPVTRTQEKLREMILDEKLRGTLDQGNGVLIVFEKEEIRSTYDNALKTIKNTSDVLDTLYGMAKQVV